MHAPRWVDSELEALARPSILVVEDDQDIRELLSTLLELADYSPSVCGSAEQALELLREQQFDLILTDYMLPNRTGGWLIRQAHAEGLLEATPALLVTAYPQPSEVEGVEVIPKPFDLDELVECVRKKLDGKTLPRKGRRTNSSSKSSRNGQSDDDCPDPIELILYVSAQSSHSVAALENIQNVLTRYKSSRIKLTIHDLSRSPGQTPVNGGTPVDGVALTAALAQKSPGPRTFILGHITNPELLLELLESCEGELRSYERTGAPASSNRSDSSAPVSSRRSRAKQKRR